jgi:hypothetical protein
MIRANKPGKNVFKLIDNVFFIPLLNSHFLTPSIKEQVMGYRVELVLK